MPCWLDNVWILSREVVLQSLVEFKGLIVYSVNSIGIQLNCGCTSCWQTFSVKRFVEGIENSDMKVNSCHENNPV